MDSALSLETVMCSSELDLRGNVRNLIRALQSAPNLDIHLKSYSINHLYLINVIRNTKIFTTLYRP